MTDKLEGPDGLIELTVPLEAKMNLGIVTDFISFPRFCVGRAVRKTKRVLGNAHSTLCVTKPQFKW